MNEGMEEGMERLELKIAYLERAAHDLSDVVYRQQQEIDALRLQLKTLMARLEAMKAEPASWTPEQERPPHY